MTKELTSKNLSGRWCVVTHQLLQEVVDGNPTAWALATPIRIFGEKLHQVAEEAQRINDPLLNVTMIELALYENADPYNPDAQIDACNEYKEAALNGEIPTVNQQIEALTKERDDLLAQLNSKPSVWTDINEDKPDRNQIVDVWLSVGKKGKRLTNMRYMVSLERFRSLSTGFEYSIDEAKHWMPAPEAPKAKLNQD